MTHNSKMPNVTKVMQEAQADEIAYVIVGALPMIIAAAIRAWKVSEFEEGGLEARIELVMDTAAKKLIELRDSQKE